MIELHYRGMRIAFLKPRVIQDSEGTVNVDGLPVDESYDEIVAKLKPSDPAQWRRGYEAAEQHINYLGLESAQKLEGDTEWHRGFKAAVAQKTGFHEGGLVRELEPLPDAVAVLPLGTSNATRTGVWQCGYDAASEVIKQLGFDSAELMAIGADSDWYDGFKHRCAMECMGEEHAADDETYALPATKECAPVYMNPLTGETNTLDMWTRLGFARKDLAEVISDGQGGWVPVEMLGEVNAPVVDPFAGEEVQYYRNPGTGAVMDEKSWMAFGYNPYVFCEVIPDGQGGWTPVE